MPNMPWASLLLIATTAQSQPALQLASTLVAQDKRRELIVLPLREDGVKPSKAITAWKSVTREFQRQRKKLNISTSLQKKQHDFLIGPAQEQARDCGKNAECLSEIGVTLGVDILVYGVMSKKNVQLQAYDVARAKPLASGTSRTRSKSAKRRGSAAAKSLIKNMKSKKGSAPVAAKTDPQDGGGEPDPSDLVKDDETGGGKDKSLGGIPAFGATDTPGLSASAGSIRLSASQLSGVMEVEVDGVKQYFMSDGSMVWNGSPGLHTLIARRADGSSVSQDITVEPGQTAEPALVFPAVADTADPDQGSGGGGESVTSKWWFWTAIGGAVVAGGTTAAVLASGAKGGPFFRDNTGTVRGTY